MKTDVFERLAKLYASYALDARKLIFINHREEARELRHRRDGVLESVEALGFEQADFKRYYQKHRRRLFVEIDGIYDGD